MTDIKDGGPAFPVATETASYGPVFQAGMTLRDWFAGMALQGLLAHEGRRKRLACDAIEEKSKYIVDDALVIADAMIAAREEKK